MEYILNAEQAAEVKTVITAENFLTANKLISDQYIPFKKERLKFDTNFKTLSGLIPLKDTDAKTIVVDDQIALKQAIAIETMIIHDQVKAYAIEYKNDALLKEFKFSKTTILSISQPELSPFITRIMGYLTPLLDDEDFKTYQITAADIKSITDKAELYNSNIGLANTTGHDVTIINKSINNVLGLLYANLDQMGLLNSFFTTRNPTFYEGFKLNTQKQYPAVHSTAMEGYVVDKNGQPLKDVMVRIVGTDKTAITNEKGYFIIYSLNVGTFQAIASNAGGDSQTLEVEIRYRHTVKYNFSL